MLSVALVALVAAPRSAAGRSGGGGGGAPPPAAAALDFRRGLGDLALFAALRGALVSATYAYGMWRQFLRPYLYTAYATGAGGVAYALAKGYRFDYGAAAAWPAQAAALALFGTLGWVHVLAARDTVAWARRRAALGLAAFPWEPGLAGGGAALLPRHANGGPYSSGADDYSGGAGAGDVPPEALADPDSNFTPVGALWVQWKEALPPAPAPAPPLVLSPPNTDAAGGAAATEPAPAAAAADAGAATAVILLHSGGGGAFAWRHVMADLAARTGARVVAFDRPGFGLTSRPPAPAAAPSADKEGGAAGGGGGDDDNPYSPAAQARLTLQLAAALGIRRAVLVGHGDGCLVAILAAALAERPRRGRGGLGRAPSSASGSQRPPSVAAASDLRMSESTDLGGFVGASSLGSCSDAADLLTPPPAGRPSAAAAETARRRAARQAAAAAAAAAAAGDGGAAPPFDGRSGSAGAQSDSVSLAASLSFQSLLASVESSQQLQQQQQQQQRAGRSRLSQQQSPDLFGGASAAAAAAAAAVHAPPELQAMSPGTGSGGLAPQLWPRGGNSCGTAGDEGSNGDGDSAGPSLDAAAAPPPPALDVAGVALLHPKLSGHALGAFARLLVRARLGRAALRPLLRGELGEVASRRAWWRPERCTRAVLELYRRPLRVEGWDAALLAAAAAGADGPPRRAVGRALAALRRAPAALLVATGAHDRVSPPVNAGRLAATLGARVAAIPGCAHLSHEEAPGALLDVLAPFVGEALSKASTTTGGGGGAGGDGGGDADGESSVATGG